MGSGFVVVGEEFCVFEYDVYVEVFLGQFCWVVDGVDGDVVVYYLQVFGIVFDFVGKVFMDVVVLEQVGVDCGVVEVIDCYYL